MKQLEQVSTLIKRLGETAAEMAEQGVSAPRVTVSNAVVQAIYTLNPAGKEAAEKAGRTPLTFHALTPDGNERFHDAITAAEVA